MILVQNDFRTRAEEVIRYFSFLSIFDEKRISFTDSPLGVNLDADEQTALFKTLKANGFLLLYNLIESTLKNAIEAIFDELGNNSVTFDDCRNDVKLIVLNNLKKHNVDKIAPILSNISIDVVAKTFRKEELFSGNVDAKRVREIANSYGFKEPSRKSDELLTVKTNRNDLAHGNKSFADVGRDFDLARLDKIKTEVLDFLEELLNNINDYIIAKLYLLTPPTPPPPGNT